MQTAEPVLQHYYSSSNTLLKNGTDFEISITDLVFTCWWCPSNFCKTVEVDNRVYMPASNSIDKGYP